MVETQETLDTRTAILNATERLLADDGYKKMTMEDVAGGAGLGRRTIYLHFRSKKQLALGVIDRIIDHLLAELRKIAASQTARAEAGADPLLERSPGLRGARLANHGSAARAGPGASETTGSNPRGWARPGGKSRTRFD
jgi:AcrR family transcriptional regulator